MEPDPVAEAPEGPAEVTPVRSTAYPGSPEHRTKGGESSRSREPRWAPGTEKEVPQDVSSLALTCNRPSPKVIPTAVTVGITTAEESNRTQR